MWKRAAVVLVVLVALALVAGLLAIRPTPVAPEPMAVAPVAAAPRAVRPPPAAVAPPDAPPPAYLAGHAAIAGALGYVAVKCWVGTEWDTDGLVGEFHQKIEGGWYTNVETALSGEHGVERRYEDPAAPLRTGFETLFVVSWSATEPGGVVPCHVEQIEHAELRVRVVDAADRPVPGARVSGCGASGESDAAGLAVLDEAKARHECVVRGQVPHDGGGVCAGQARVPALAADETRDVVVALQCRELGEEPRVSAGARSEPWPIQLPERTDAEELAVLQDLSRRDLGDAGDRLIDELVAHKERMAAWRAQVEARITHRNELMAKIAALEGLDDAGSVAERQRLGAEVMQAMQDELKALQDDMEALGIPAAP